MRSLWLVIRVLVVLAVLVGAAGLGARWYASRELYGAGPATQPTTVVIAKGSRTGAIGKQLEQAGVIRHGWFREAAVLALDTGKPLHAGEYAFLPGETLHEVLRQMRDGRTVVHKLTAPEGLSVAEIVGIINQRK